MAGPSENPLAGSRLGRAAEYPQTYDPKQLFAVSRQVNRQALQLQGWPWAGFDLWYAYELSWLNPGGLPQVAMARLTLPVDSPCLIESKSLKLYLNSLNMTRFDDWAAVQTCIEQDLSAAAQAPVNVELVSVEAPLGRRSDALAEAICLDQQDIAIEHYGVDPGLLQRDSNRMQAREMLYSHLLRSNCPVTGQPDWGSVVIDYAGPALDREALLRYLVSFRGHTEFHEHCVERIFTDLLALGDFERLLVRAHYTRRGGLDINPCRSLTPEQPDMGRWPRQ